MAIFKSKKKDAATDQSGKKPREKKEAQVKDKGQGLSMKELYGPAAAPDKKSEGKAAPKSSARRAYRILLKPLVTEKVTQIGAQNQYGFEVASNANKIEISKAIEELYGVKPVKVNIVYVKGKKIRYGKIQGKRKDRKKAYITLPAGKSISVYEGV